MAAFRPSTLASQTQELQAHKAAQLLDYGAIWPILAAQRAVEGPTKTLVRPQLGHTLPINPFAPLVLHMSTWALAFGPRSAAYRAHVGMTSYMYSKNCRT